MTEASPATNDECSLDYGHGQGAGAREERAAEQCRSSSTTNAFRGMPLGLGHRLGMILVRNSSLVIIETIAIFFQFVFFLVCICITVFNSRLGLMCLGKKGKKGINFK